jgi:hypothetical protein
VTYFSCGHTNPSYRLYVCVSAGADTQRLSEGEPVTTQFYLTEEGSGIQREGALKYPYCSDAKLNSSTGNGERISSDACRNNPTVSNIA